MVVGLAFWGRSVLLKPATLPPAEVYPVKSKIRKQNEFRLGWHCDKSKNASESARGTMFACFTRPLGHFF